MLTPHEISSLGIRIDHIDALLSGNITYRSLDKVFGWISISEVRDRLGLKPNPFFYDTYSRFLHYESIEELEHFQLTNDEIEVLRWARGLIIPVVDLQYDDDDCI